MGIGNDCQIAITNPDTHERASIRCIQLLLTSSSRIIDDAALSLYASGMHGHVRNSEDSVIAAISTHCAKVGVNKEFVQGAAGNVSIKSENTIYIKASGTRLKDAQSKNILVALDLKKARGMAFDEDQDFSAAIISEYSNLTPSIETSMHLLIDAPCVSHLHTVRSISRAIDKNVDRVINEVSDICNLSFIPYSKPGLELSKSIIEFSDPGSEAFLLGNHGVTVWGENFSEVENKILKLETRWAEASNKSESEALVMKKWWDAQLISGYLTPDEAVFLIQNEEIYTDENLPTSPFKIGQNGKVVLLESIGEDGQEIANSLIEVGKFMLPNTEINLISRSEVIDLLNWDAEKARRKLAK